MLALHSHQRPVEEHTSTVAHPRIPPAREGWVGMGLVVARYGAPA